MTAQELGVPDVFNAAAYFVDRHLGEGRADKIAIECREDRISYGQLAERVNRCGSALADSLGVRPEERVALVALDGPEFVYTFFGAIKIGAVPVPVNTLWTSADYQYVLNDSRARVLVVSEALRPRFDAIPASALPHLRHVIVIRDRADQPPPALADGAIESRTFSDLLTCGRATLDAAATSRDDVAFWMYSSGSTGAPKGCVHLQHDMVICAELYARGVLGLNERDRSFSVAKLFFAYGLGNGMYFPLGTGGTAILWPGPPSAENVFRVIGEHRPTVLYSVPTGYAMMLAHAEAGTAAFDLSSVRYAISAGEPLPPALAERFTGRFGIEMLDGIGSTETLHMFISNRPGAVRSGSSGQLITGYDARIVDESGADVAVGEVGNLLIRGDSVCAGYWNKHERTKDTISGHWIKTGDKYSRDADGYFWYAGRSDDMLKVGGIWVSPVEVEMTLAAHPAVHECAVVGATDHDGLVKPAAYVILRQDIGGDAKLAEELQRFVVERLAEYKRPRWVEFLPDLPRTATGKIQRFKLRERPVRGDR
jgi:benzoate-CoA ligase